MVVVRGIDFDEPVQSRLLFQEAFETANLDEFTKPVTALFHQERGDLALARDEKLQKRFLRPKPSLQLLGDLLGFDQPLVFKFQGDVPSLGACG